MRIASAGHAAFAVTMIGLGIFDLITGNPVPQGVPGRGALVILCAVILIASGIGLLWRRTAAIAARALLAYFLLELVVLRLPRIAHLFSVDVYWALAENLVLVAAAWVLYDWFATDWDRQHLGFALGDNGLRIARALYGAALIPFGIAHFEYIDHTASMVPNWLPAHLAFAYFTGGAFIAAGLAILLGVYARLAAVLSTLQIGGFLLLVWVPAVVAGGLSDFQKGEVVANCILLAAAWVVTDSYRGIHVLASARASMRSA